MARTASATRNQYIKNISQNIPAFVKAKNVDATKMAQRLGIGLTTWYRRLKHPEEITVFELTVIATELGTTPEKLLCESIF